MWMIRSTPAPARTAFSILTSSSGLAPSPSSRLFVSMARMTAMTTSSRPIPAVPTPSQTPLPVISVSVTPKSAKTRPISAPASSSSTTGSSGAFARRTYVTHEVLPRVWFDSTIAVRKE
jgi:hypothetical protein